MVFYGVNFLVLYSGYVRERPFLEGRPDAFRGEGGKKAERGGRGERTGRPGESSDEHMQI